MIAKSVTQLVRIKTLTVLVFLLSSVCVAAQLQVYDSEHRRVEVTFGRKLVQKDLDHIQSTLLQYGITLRYDELGFDKKGRLVNIAFSVDCKDGFSGSGTKEGLTKQSRYGFFRDYAADATASQPPFGIGDLD